MYKEGGRSHSCARLNKRKKELRLKHLSSNPYFFFQEETNTGTIPYFSRNSVLAFS